MNMPDEMIGAHGGDVVTKLSPWSVADTVTRLLAVAAAVIGGTSLFGGRGSVWTALLGALVIGSISNGMDLLALSSAVKFMVTGGVLLLAVIVDAIARQQRLTSGRV